MANNKLNKVLLKFKIISNWLFANYEMTNNPINVSLSFFSILLILTFTYFIFYSNQLTNIKSNIITKIVEINSISSPLSIAYLTLVGHDEYQYIKRKEVLLSDFNSILNGISIDTLNSKERKYYGGELQRIISQTAFFYPFKRLLTFKKDGSLEFNPGLFESIQTTKNFIKANPSDPDTLSNFDNYNMHLLRQQIDHIIYFQEKFTNVLKNAKVDVLVYLAAYNDIKTEHELMRLNGYIEDLINYLEKHYHLGISLGLEIKSYEYYLAKFDHKLLLSSAILISFIIVFGILLPSLSLYFRQKRIFFITSILSFLIGTTILIVKFVENLPK